MVRSPSGVTTIMQRPVGSPSVAEVGGEVHAERVEVVAERLAEAVVLHPADVGGPAAEGRHARQRVGGRAARRLGLVAHGGVELLGPIGVDERHRPLGQVELVDERLVLGAEHVDEGVADPEHVEGGRSRCVGLLTSRKP